MNPNWAEVATAIAAIAAVAISAFAWFTAQETLKTSYRPVLRVVPLWTGTPRVAMCADQLKLKNVGNGPALAVMLFQADDGVAAQMIGSVDVVEPLGDRPNGREADRVGNVVMYVLLPNKLEDGHSYRLVYQDLSASWHETRFTLPRGERNEFAHIRFLGRHRWWQLQRRVPKRARERGHVARPSDITG